MRIFLPACFCVFFPFLVGCALETSAPPIVTTGAAIAGHVHGGQQPVVGAHVYLYAANTAGYNTTAGTYGSVSLLNSNVLTNNPLLSGMDSSGNYYVVSDGNGDFSISGDYSCTADAAGVPGQQVYLYAVGGNAGAGANASAGFLAVLGDCPAATNFAAVTPTVFVNEVSTVAAAYAMAGFAWDATHVSSSATMLAKVGVKNAFANASNLANLATGVAYAITPAANGGNGAVPQSTINTLADVLAACVNSNGAVTGPTNATTCYTLFYNAENGTTVPGDTATAAINIAHHPGANVAALYGSPTPTSPFAPTLNTQPNDFTIGINYTGGNLTYPAAIAIDASGNAWVANADGQGVITEISPAGAFVSGANGYAVAGLGLPESIAIDRSGNVWVGDYYSNITKLSSAGGNLSGTNGFTGGGITSAYGIALDVSGNAWIANGASNSVSELSNTGTVLSGGGTGAYTGGGLNYDTSVAIDGSGNTWASNYYAGVTKISNGGTFLSGTTGFTSSSLTGPEAIALDSGGNAWIPNAAGGNNVVKLSNTGTVLSGTSGFTGGGLDYPHAIAIDGGGNAWVANPVGSSVTELSSSGTLLCPTKGFLGGLLNYPEAIAVDGSGDVWVGNVMGTAKSVTELIGAALPVITPIAAGLPSTPTSDGSSNLGTRP